MKKLLSWATLLAVLASMHFAGSPAAAQQGPRPQIAVIDLTYIFGQHLRFKQMMEDLQRDVDSARNELNANRQQVVKMGEQLDGYNRGSPEYKQLEEDVTKRQADLQVHLQRMKRDFAEREAKMYYTVYKEIMEQVQSYADKHGILLVMQFNGEQPDDTDPAALKSELYKQILFHHPAIDITPIILDMVNPPVRAKNNGPRQGPPAASNRPQTTSRPGVPPKQR